MEVWRGKAAFRVTEDLRPEETQLMPLSLLVLGEEETRETLAKSSCYSD